MEQLDYDLLLCQLLAFVIEVSLLGDVIEVEWVRVGLVRGRRAMSYDDDIAARAQPLDQRLRVSTHTVLTIQRLRHARCSNASTTPAVAARRAAAFLENKVIRISFALATARRHIRMKCSRATPA